MLTNKIGINSYMLEQSFTGIEIYTKKLIDGIKERNINIELYSYSNLSNHPEYSNILKSSKNEVCIGQLKKLFWNLIQINSLVSNDTYIFHAPSFILPYFLPSKLKKIITVHDLAFLRYPQYATFKEKLYYKLTLKHSLKNADIIIAISKSTQNDIEEFFPEYSKKIKLIYNGYEDFSKIKSDDNISKKMLDNVQNIVNNKPYDYNLGDWICIAFGLKRRRTIKRFWCSALVSYILCINGDIDENTDWTMTTAKDLSSNYNTCIKWNSSYSEDLLLGYF